MRKLHKCPSCNGDAELISFPVSDDTLWQVNCKSCGMATEYSDDQVICIQNWNRRDEEDKLRTRVMALAVVLPLGMALTFLLGVLLVLGSNS